MPIQLAANLAAGEVTRAGIHRGRVPIIRVHVPVGVPSLDRCHERRQRLPGERAPQVRRGDRSLDQKAAHPEIRQIFPFPTKADDDPLE